MQILNVRIFSLNTYLKLLIISNRTCFASGMYLILLTAVFSFNTGVSIFKIIAFITFYISALAKSCSLGRYVFNFWCHMFLFSHKLNYLYGNKYLQQRKQCLGVSANIWIMQCFIKQIKYSISCNCQNWTKYSTTWNICLT